jgi:hypothetical protein
MTVSSVVAPQFKAAEHAMPFRDFLLRVRKLIPLDDDEHYKSIARDLESGFFRQPVQPMSDSELASAIAEFRKAAPTAASRGALGDAFNPRKN